ncbi:MAG: hypothetical protein ABSE21_04795 [Bryobacteraceae bacterium]|jgi:hypothetical protein
MSLAAQSSTAAPPQEPHYGLGQLSRMHGLANDFLRRSLCDYPGVLVVHHPATPSKRPYTVYKVPASIFARWYNSCVNPTELPAGRKAVR